MSACKTASAELSLFAVLLVIQAAPLDLGLGVITLQSRDCDVVNSIVFESSCVLMLKGSVHAEAVVITVD